MHISVVYSAAVLISSCWSLYFTLPLVSYRTPRTPIRLLVESDRTARTLLRLKQLVQKSKKNQLGVQARTSSNCSCLGEILIKILIKTTYIIKVKHYQYKVIIYKIYNRADMAQRAWGAVPVGCR
jgi:hypothetical protein